MQWGKAQTLTWDKVSRLSTSPAGSDRNKAHNAKATVDVPTDLWTVWALSYSGRTNMLSCLKSRKHDSLVTSNGCLHLDTAVSVQGAKFNCPGASYDYYYDHLWRSANVICVTWQVMKHLLWLITLCMSGGGIKLLGSCMSAWCVNKLFHEANLPLQSKEGAGMKRLREKALGKQPFGRLKFKQIEVTCTCNNYWPEKQNMVYRPRRNLRQVWWVRVDLESHYNPSRMATGATVSQECYLVSSES